MEPTTITLRQLTILLSAMLLIWSCERDAFFDVPNGGTKLYAYSEITTTEKVKVFVNTAPGINTEDNFIFPKQSDAQVILMQEGEPLLDAGFRYNASEKAFISQGTFRPEAGVEYNLLVKLKDNSIIEPIFATTTIPDFLFLENIRAHKLLEKAISPTLKDFEVTAEINFTENLNQHFILKPYFTTSNGQVVPMLLQDVVIGSNGAAYSNFNGGILIDPKKVGQNLELVLINEESVDRSEKVGLVSFEVITITPEAFNYFTRIGKQSDSQSSALSEPVISYTNFEKGLGLFSGYSSQVQEAIVY